MSLRDSFAGAQDLRLDVRISREPRPFGHGLDLAVAGRRNPLLEDAMTNDASIAALPARRTSEVRLASPVRNQAAFVRALLDEVERVAPAGGDRALNEQLAEELTLLGCRCVELASALRALIDAQEKATHGTAHCA